MDKMTVQARDKIGLLRNVAAKRIEHGLRHSENCFCERSWMPRVSRTSLFDNVEISDPMAEIYSSIVVYPLKLGGFILSIGQSFLRNSISSGLPDKRHGIDLDNDALARQRCDLRAALLVEFGQGLAEINMAFFILHGTCDPENFRRGQRFQAGHNVFEVAAKRFFFLPRARTGYRCRTPNRIYGMKWRRRSAPVSAS
jgi:hypothetical protein